MFDFRIPTAFGRFKRLKFVNKLFVSKIITAVEDLETDIFIFPHPGRVVGP